jgi:hypothetical protein
MTAATGSQTSIDVLRALVSRLQLQSARLLLIEHTVGVNWRVMHPSTEGKLAHLSEGLVQHSPINTWELSGSEVLADEFSPAQLISGPHRAISVTSKVQLDGSFRHMAMMNLHPDDRASYEDLVLMLETVTGGMPGYLLETGRYYHFYGDALLTQREWLRFLAQFLMPTILLSPRYIGHCLNRGFSALRLTVEPDYKPTMPIVREKFPIPKRPLAGPERRDDEPDE